MLLKTETWKGFVEQGLLYADVNGKIKSIILENIPQNAYWLANKTRAVDLCCFPAAEVQRQAALKKEKKGETQTCSCLA